MMPKGRHKVRISDPYEEQSCCKVCASKCAGFQKVLAVPDAGYVLYRHTTKVEDINKQTGAIETTTDTTDDVFILENTQGIALGKLDFTPEIDRSQIKCPRCVQLLKRAQKLLKNQDVGKSDIVGICQHCRKFGSTCLKCEEAVEQFQESRKSQKQGHAQQVKSWLSKIQKIIKVSLFDDKKERQQAGQIVRAHSDVNLKNLLRKITKKDHEPEIGDLFFHEIRDLYSTKRGPRSERPYDPEAKKDKELIFYEPSQIYEKEKLGFTQGKREDSLMLSNITLSENELEKDFIRKFGKSYKGHQKFSSPADSKWFQDEDFIPIPEIHHEYEKKKDEPISKHYYGDTKLSSESKKYIEEKSFGVHAQKDLKSVADIYHDEEGQRKYELTDEKLYEDDKKRAKSVPKTVVEYDDIKRKEFIMAADKISSAKESEKFIGRKAEPETKIIFESPTHIKKYRSEESLLTGMTKMKDDVQKQKTFDFYFPETVTEDRKKIKSGKVMSSSELIKDTLDKLKIKIEEERRKRQEAERLKEERRRKLEQEKKEREAKMLAHKMEKIKQEAKHNVSKEIVLKDDQVKDKALKDKLSKEKVTKDIASKGKASTEKLPKEKVPKEKVSKEKISKEKLPKEKVSREKILKEKISKEQESKDKPSKEKVDKEKESKEKASKEKESKEKEFKEKDIKEKASKEKDSKEKDSKEKESKEKESKEKESKEKASKEKESKEKESKQKESNEKESKEKELKERVKKESPDLKKKETLEKSEKTIREDSGKEGKSKEGKEKEEKTKEEKVKVEKTKDEKGPTTKEDNEKDKKKRELEAQELKKKMEQEQRDRENQIKELRLQREEARKQKLLDQQKEKEEAAKKKQAMQAAMPQQKIELTKIKVKKPSVSDLTEGRKKPKGPPKELKIPTLLEFQMHMGKHGKKESNCDLCMDSDFELEVQNRFWKIGADAAKKDKWKDAVLGTNIYKYKTTFGEIEAKEPAPFLFHRNYERENYKVADEVKDIIIQDDMQQKSQKAVKQDQEYGKGVIHYALSNRLYIDKGWTQLPTEKVVRKMNVYRMRPAHPEFDWFEHNKRRGEICYDSGERLAEFDDNGRGRWFYRSGLLALDHYNAEEMNAQQRFVVYSSGEPDQRGRSRPRTVLASFDYLGNGIVFDHTGKIRLKYNQTEGIVLDRSLGPVSHWKWHTLNDPPVLQQVMIDTQMAHKDPDILKLGGPGDNTTRTDDEEMLAIEFDNFIKEKSEKLTQSFKPFQIKMKALKINEYFSLRVLDQANVYLIYRDGSTNIKLNIGMILDHKEIVDTDTAEVGQVSSNLERFPAKTDSLADLQRQVAEAQKIERFRYERDRRINRREPVASVDCLKTAASKPLKPAIMTFDSKTEVSRFCRCRKPSASNVYYNTGLV